MIAVMISKYIKLSSTLLVALLAVGTASSFDHAPASVVGPTVAEATQLTAQDDGSGDMSIDAAFFPEKPPCPIVWTCDWETYYPTRAQCKAVCGAEPCAHDYGCDGSCICP
jgi:hypothetical protein